jgi:RNA polymerase sigma-70 factor (ECF subfamily)
VNITYGKAQRRQGSPVLLSTLNWNDWSFLKPALTNEVALTGDDPAQVAARRERQEVVRTALAALPSHQHVVLVLFDIEGYSYDDIAVILKLPLGTVKSRLSRARSALREELEPCRELFGV